jgi:hypothetical protein
VRIFNFRGKEVASNGDPGFCFASQSISWIGYEIVWWDWDLFVGGGSLVFFGG